jgi:GTP-binding protein Era
MHSPNFRAGFIAIIGKPNVGKSTLMNRFIGEKLSIVSSKPQTTRMSIRSFLNTENSQIIFLDTPGFLEPRYELHEKMRNYISDSVKNADVVLFLTDVFNFPTEYDIKVLEVIKKSKKPAIFVMNKIDITSENIPDLSLYTDDFHSIFTISAKKDENFDKLLETITNLLPYSPPLYDTENLSDMSMRFFASEIIREKIFLFFAEEIPYATTVVIEKWSEEETRDVIAATIWVEKESQKPIILGRGGSMIKKIRIAAERDILKLTGRSVVLNLWVKVKHDWRKKKGSLHEFGYK